MDYIHIDALSFAGKHGVYDKERDLEQEFAVSVRLGFDLKKAGGSDTLSDTLDYQQVKNAIGEIISGKSHYLIETLAEKIASRILEDTRIHSVELSIRKTGVWENGIPGVTILRSSTQ